MTEEPDKEWAKFDALMDALEVQRGDTLSVLCRNESETTFISDAERHACCRWEPCACSCHH